MRQCYRKSHAEEKFYDFMKIIQNSRKLSKKCFVGTESEQYMLINVVIITCVKRVTFWKKIYKNSMDPQQISLNYEL